MAYLTPGVYVEEKSSGDKPITGVGTGTGGFVGVAEKGPINKATLITSWAEYRSVFGGYVNYIDTAGNQVEWYMPYAVEQFFKEGGSKCYIIRTVSSTDASPIAAASGSISDGTSPTLNVEATSAGVWGNKLAVAIAAATDIQLTGGFKLIVLEGKTDTGPYSAVEEYDNLTKDDLSATEISPNVVVTNIPGNLNPPQTTVVLTNGKISDYGESALSGGDDGLEGISQADFIGAPSETAPTGMYAFDPIDAVNMIAIPDVHYANLDPASYTDTVYAISNGLAYCQNRQDCFFIGDVPRGMAPLEARDFKTGTDPNSPGFSSSYGALYYPWVKATFGVKNVLMPPSGAVMGMISRTDAARGVFKAPAGVIDGKLISINGLERQVGHGEQEELNPKGVNVIRFFPGPGNVVWGARTCSSGVDAEWHYINVRRYFMYVEETLDEGTQWVVFEPNTPSLWGNVKRNITAFLTNEWRAGALFGNSAEEAFYVKVDAENNPPSVRDQGQLIIEIGIAPVKPAEFVIIRISQKTLSA